MSDTQIILPMVRFSYLNALTPKAAKNSTEEKYSTQIIIPKKDTETVSKVKKIVEGLKEAAKAANKGKLPNGFKTPLKDGDAKDEDGDKIHGAHLHGCIFFNASSKNKPGVLNERKEPVMDKEEIYSGMWGAVNVNFYIFNNQSQGIAAGLNHIMKRKDGERLDNRISAEDAFDGIEAIDEDGLGLGDL